MTHFSWREDARIAAQLALLQKGVRDFSGTTEDFARHLKARTGPVIGIFGSARSPEQAPAMHASYGEGVRTIGHLLGEAGTAMIGGHCPGLPEEAELAFKAARRHVCTQPLIGVRIVLRQPDGSIFEPTDPDKVDIYSEHDKFGTRIEVMEHLADGGIFPPGGVGTRTELYMFLQKLQLGGYLGRRIPLVLFGTTHWRNVIEDFRQMVRDKTLKKKEFYITSTDDPEEAVRLMLAANGNAERARRALTGSMRV